MAVPIDAATGPGGPPPGLAPSVPGKAIEGRSLGQIAWMRLRRDKVAMGGGVVIVFLILVAIIGPHIVRALVARGHTNREIAEALVISIKTTGHHVSHILHKLDVPTRSDAAAIAHRLTAE